MGQGGLESDKKGALCWGRKGGKEITVMKTQGLEITEKNKWKRRTELLE